MQRDFSFKEGAFKRTVAVMGIDVLITPISDDEVSSSGKIIIPERKDGEDPLLKGYVRLKGPGFLLPSFEEPVLENEKDSKPRYVLLDLLEGDLVYYTKRAATEVWLNGKSYVLVPYPAIRLRVREETLNSLEEIQSAQ
jgi:co-chaperonin GroES (HSP10)